MTDRLSDKPDQRAALDALIRQTITEMGALDPAELPHRVRERLAGQALDGADLDARVKAALREMEKAGRRR